MPVIGQFFFSAGSRLPDLKKIRQKDERDFSSDHVVERALISGEIPRFTMA